MAANKTTIDWSDLNELYTTRHLSAIKIAGIKDCGDMTVYYHLKKAGILLRTRAEANKARDDNGNPKYDFPDLKELYIDQKLNTVEIGKIKGCNNKTISLALRQQSIPVRSISEAQLLAFGSGKRQAKKGKLNPCWKGGRKTHSSGYILLYKPDNPRAGKDGYVLEHLLVWEQVHNRPLPTGWVIHHLNGIKDDNRPENLVGMPHRKHTLVLAAKAQRIRELETKVKLLEKAIDENQLMFNFQEN